MESKKNKHTNLIDTENSGGCQRQGGGEWGKWINCFGFHFSLNKLIKNF